MAEPLEDRTLLTIVVTPSQPLPPGSLDPTFNQSGLATTLVGSADQGGVGALDDGKIVVAGTIVESDGTRTVTVVRYQSNGQSDSSFGTAGTGVFALPSALQIQSVGAVAVVNDPGQPDDGDIVVAGTRNDPAAADPLVLALFRLTAGGALDPGFGSGGVALDDHWYWLPTAAERGARLAARRQDLGRRCREIPDPLPAPTSTPSSCVSTPTARPTMLSQAVGPHFYSAELRPS